MNGKTKLWRLSRVSCLPVEVLYPPVDRHDGQDAEYKERALEGFLINKLRPQDSNQYKPECS